MLKKTKKKQKNSENANLILKTDRKRSYIFTKPFLDFIILNKILPKKCFLCRYCYKK